MNNEELWSKTVELSNEAPYIFSSRRYALKGAAEKVAEDLTKKRAGEFLKYAYERYKYESNYAGD